MLNVFLAIAQIFIDSGFSNALVQKKDRNEEDFSTVFYFNAILSVLFYVLFFCCAPLIADFYDESRLILIIRVSFLSLIINSVSIIQRTVLQLRYDFKTNAIINLWAILFSGSVALVCAYLGYGVWALITQTLLMSIVSTIALWLIVKWHPLVVFSISSFKKLFNYGSKLLGCALADTIYTNIYNLIIGKAFTSSDLGLYNRAYTLSQLPSRNIYYSLRGVIFTFFCEQQSDKESLENSYEMIIKSMCYYIFPIMVFLSFFSNEIILILLSDKWLGCAIYLSILSIAFMFFPIMISLWDLVNSLGYSDYTFKAEIIKKIIGFSLIAISLPFGIIALCFASLFNNISDMLVMTYYSRKVTTFGYLTLLRILYPFFLLSFGAVTIASSIRIISSNEYIVFIVGGIIFIISYIILSRLFKFEQYKILEKILKIK